MKLMRLGPVGHEKPVVRVHDHYVDVSERAFQIECGGQWSEGKSSDTFNPAGPWLATPDGFDDVVSLGIDRLGEQQQTVIAPR